VEARLADPYKGAAERREANVQENVVRLLSMAVTGFLAQQMNG